MVEELLVLVSAEVGVALSRSMENGPVYESVEFDYSGAEATKAVLEPSTLTLIVSHVHGPNHS